MEGLRPTALQTFAIPIITGAGKDVKIIGLESIGSYNWTTASSPTIMVPGKFCDIEIELSTNSVQDLHRNGRTGRPLTKFPPTLD